MQFHRIYFKTFSLFAILCFPLLTCIGQGNSSDSIISRIADEDDTTKINALIEYSQLLLEESPIEALNILQEAQLIAQNLKEKKWLAKIWMEMGYHYQDLNQDYIALSHFLKALPTLEFLKDKLAVSKLHNLIGISYQRVDNYEMALNYFTAGIKLDSTHNNEKELSKKLYNLGLMYFESDQLDLAQKAFENSLEIEERIGSLFDIYYDFMALGELAIKRGHYTDALEYYSQGTFFSSMQGTPGNRIESMVEKAICLGKLERYTEAENIFKAVRDSLKTYKIPTQELNYTLKISTYYKDKNQLDSAYAYLNKYVDLIRNDKNEEQAYWLNAYTKLLEKNTKTLQENLKSDREESKKSSVPYSILFFLCILIVILIYYLKRA